MGRTGGPELKVVVKIGGAALDNKKLLHDCSAAIAGLAQQGHRVAVVHGGGVELTRTLKQLGMTSTFVNGLRITDEQTRDVALMVLAGRVNKMLVAALDSAYQPAVGMCGGDGASFRARKKNSGGVDLGFVGEICYVDPRWIEAIWSIGAVPVISSIALGVGGEFYNINADQMASACASACQADALIFLTDVAGVKGADGEVIRWLSVPQISALERSAVVSGGMLPKLEACKQALHKGVKRIRILSATQACVLPEFYAVKVDVGTEVTSA
jgi:acetylglutamate kinase